MKYNITHKIVTPRTFHIRRNTANMKQNFSNQIMITSQLRRLKDSPSNEELIVSPHEDDMNKSMIVRDDHGLDDYEISKFTRNYRQDK